MITYTYRCDTCWVDWDKQFPIDKYPEELICPTCKGIAKKVIISSRAPVFKVEGFPGNDAKGLHTGKSNMPGRKPTHKELDYIEQAYPDSNKKRSYEHGDI